MCDTLTQLLERGRLGAIQIGMSQRALTDYAGGPDDTGILGRHSRVFVYGFTPALGPNVQVTLIDGTVSLVGVYFYGKSDLSRIPGCFAAHEWGISGSTNAIEYRIFLERNQINWVDYCSKPHVESISTLPANIVAHWMQGESPGLEKIVMGKEYW